MADREYLNMIWGNEAGKSLWFYKAEQGCIGLEVCGLVEQQEQVLVDIVIETHNFTSLIETVTRHQRATCSRGAQIGESLGIVP